MITKPTQDQPAYAVKADGELIEVMGYEEDKVWVKGTGIYTKPIKQGPVIIKIDRVQAHNNENIYCVYCNSVRFIYG
jgi:hypothetical protein